MKFFDSDSEAVSFSQCWSFPRIIRLPKSHALQERLVDEDEAEERHDGPSAHPTDPAAESKVSVNSSEP